MTIREMIELDLDYFENVDDEQELVDCKEAIEGDKLLLRRLNCGYDAMGPITVIELEALVRLHELYDPKFNKD